MIYQLEFDRRLTLINTDDFSIFKAWKNPHPIANWQPVAVQFTDEAEPADVMGLRSIMVWHRSLLDGLSVHDFQALPIQLENESYYAIHITQVRDCLDAEHSQFKRFKNRNIGVEHYVLRRDCADDTMLFTIPDDGYSAIFATEKFRLVVVENDWTGLTFLPVALVD